MLQGCFCWYKKGFLTLLCCIRRWETLRVNYIVLGAVLMLWAHTLFLLLVARNFALTRE